MHGTDDVSPTTESHFCIYAFVFILFPQMNHLGSKQHAKAHHRPSLNFLGVMYCQVTYRYICTWRIGTAYWKARPSHSVLL